MTVDAEPEASPLDVALGHTLAQSYGNLSRRSFLAALTRQVMSLTGMVLASQIFPMPARGDENCGLHGHPCGTGNCLTTATGAVSRFMWVQCCVPENGCSGTYQRCTYRDYCRNSDTYGEFDPQGCAPPGPSGTTWCYPGGGPWSYVCTTTACGDTYPTLQQCRLGMVQQSGAGGECSVGFP